MCYAEISCNGVYLKVRGRRRDCDCVPHALMRPDQLACLRPDGGADALNEQPFAQFDKVFFDLTGQAGHTDVSQPSLVAAELGVGSQNEGPSEITGPDVALPQSVLVERRRREPRHDSAVQIEKRTHRGTAGTRVDLLQYGCDVCIRHQR